MGKHNGKSPVKQTISESLVDKLPASVGDKIAQNWSEKRLIKRAKTLDNQQVSDMVMRKAIFKDVRDRDNIKEVSRYEMENKVPYIVASSTSNKNIGWIMRNGAAGVGRIYEPNDYDSLKNDPDRPSEFQDIDFDTFNPEEFDMEDYYEFDESDNRESFGIDDTFIDDTLTDEENSQFE